MKIPASFLNSEIGAIFNVINVPPEENIERIRLLSFFWHIEDLVTRAAQTGEQWVPFGANLKKLHDEGIIDDDLRRAFGTIAHLRNAIAHMTNTAENREIIASKKEIVVQAWAPVAIDGVAFFENAAARVGSQLKISVSADNWGGEEFKKLFGALFSAMVFAISINQFRKENAHFFPLRMTSYRFEITA